MKEYELNRESAILSIELQEIIKECMFYHHTEMYFTMIFRQIIVREYEKRGEFFKAKLEDVLKKHTLLSSFILENFWNKTTNNYSIVNQEYIFDLLNNFDDIINYGYTYGNVIPLFVHTRTKVAELLKVELNDTSPMFFKFSKICMTEGYEISFERIIKNLENKNYLNHEVLETANAKVIKLFSTPYGMLMKDKMVELINQKEFDNYIDRYFLNYGLSRIKDLDLIDRLRTRFIFEKQNEEGLFYYKRRTKDDDYVSFGEQNRKNPFYAIVVEGQLNLTWINSESIS
jgi:hypothetical protein